MNRIVLFKQLLDEKRNSTMIHEHYLNTIREYAPGTNLYMREMHFLMAADPEQPVSITDLAQKLGVTLGAASQMATKLEKGVDRAMSGSRGQEADHGKHDR